MKHIQAGFLVGALLLATVAVLALVWRALAVLIGDVPAIGGVIVVVVVAIGATLIDWMTEKKEAP